MAIIKCKMCGGDLELIADMTVAECEYCGTRQTVPTADNEKKMTLFARANRLRAACEFDKAAGIYENIVADFPEEAEAYWGLVLCQYGIEYVDDPATGKKIPTCHRSSFESLMDDSNFELVMEFSDAVARRVYRDEAKTIEDIRKGIIEVSGREEPYDIFICYKETDFDGNRTLDSVLAQDIFEALTDKGYRVFFARISLEDKLGMEYEPYIFAALNSAKVMLAVGTDYEYYNAVWVKNEWSRFLKLIASGQKKTLIPCFKGIDAYDMPKEFARLQAQDLGKVGAMQDLLRGIEKIIPRETPKESVKETVVLQQGGNNISALLKRGAMALEDRDWNKADKFYEEVLNQNAECADAYLGKTLAVERCSTLEALAAKRLEATAEATYVEIELPKDRERAKAAVEEFYVKNYLNKEEIGRLYINRPVYRTCEASRREQRSREELWWTGHKLLSRAMRFASGGVAGEIKGAYTGLLEKMDKRISKAEAEAARHKEEAEKVYAQFLEDAYKKAEMAHQDALKTRENDYSRFRDSIKTDAEPEVLESAAKGFDAMADYRDSAVLAARCRKIASEERERRAAEAERLRASKERAARERTAKIKKTGIIVGSAAVIIIVVALLLTKVIIPGNKYKSAEELLTSKEYLAAAEAFEAMEGYKDSVKAALYAKASFTYYCAENRDLDGFDIFGSIVSEDAVGDNATTSAEPDDPSADEAVTIDVSLSAEDKKVIRMYEKAGEWFAELGDYRDSAELAAYCEAQPDLIVMNNQLAWYNKGLEYMDATEYDLAMKVFDELGAYYSDSEEMYYAAYKSTLACAKVGDTVSFGSYDGEGELEWYVLDKTPDKMLLLSKYVLEGRAFADYTTGWKDSEINEYLNDDFFDDFLDEHEQNVVLETTTDCTIYEGDTSKTETSVSRVFLLSAEEVNKYLDDTMLPGVMHPEASWDSTMLDEDGNAMWWLRSPVWHDWSSYHFVVKQENGKFTTDSMYRSDYDAGVRPAVWVDLSGSDYTVEDAYNDAVGMMNGGDYEDAYKAFLSLESYSDSDTLAMKCAVANAKALEKAGAIAEAVEWYELVGKQDKANELRFKYVNENYIYTDEATYEFLTALIDAGHPDAQSLYDELYAKEFKVVVNTDMQDKETNVTSIDVNSEYQHVYVHVLYTGGTPLEKKIDVTAEVEYLDGGSWSRWNKAYFDTLAQDVWVYHSFSNLGHYSFRFVLTDDTTGEELAKIPINVY